MGLPSAETEESSEGAGLAGKMRSLVWDVAFAAPLKCPSGDVEPQLVAVISASEPGAYGSVRGRGWAAELC